mgnify:CR=1 FL=1
MASPLNNPWVVGGLVLGGVCYALYSYVPSDWLERLEGGKISAVPPPLNVISPQSLSPDNRFFIARPLGMPEKNSTLMQKSGFGWDLFYETPKVGVSRGPMPLPSDWRLTAIYMDQKSSPAVKAAVVSGDILRVGSKKGEFVVEEIKEESLTFSHPSGKQTLSFPSEIPDKKKANK